MNSSKPFHRTALATLVLALIAAILAQATYAGQAKGKDGFSGRLEVMTQNLYVGANLFQIADPGLPPEAVPLVAAQIFADIQFTDFPQRAEAIAALVARKRPHLIGLQEVSLIRTQCPADLAFPPNATDVYADYLQILLEALAARGLHYEVAAVVENADVELPTANLNLLDCQAPVFDARLTDYDVTLRRADVQAVEILSDNYDLNFPVPTAAGDIEFRRGFNIVDAFLHGRAYRFVNTHLEVSGNPYANFFQWVQALELAGTLDFLSQVAGDRIVVAVGDFNSDPAFGEVQPCFLPPPDGPLTVCDTPYTVMHDAGFIDAWTVRNGAPDPGYTCCQEDLLTNAESWLDERIDHVWVRPPVAGPQGPHFLKAVHAEVVGDRQKDRTIDGLWPSDHAGVVAGMTLRQEK